MGTLISTPRRRELGLATLAAGTVLALWLAGSLPPLERPVADLLLRLPRPGTAAPVPVATVLIDDAALDRYGKLPWPRDRIAELVHRSYAGGARAVVLDMILAEPSDEASDEALEAAIAEGPTVLAAVLLPDGGWLLPLARFGGLHRAAHAHAEIASDGVVRKVSATKQADGLVLPALGVAAARALGWDHPLAPGEMLRPGFSRSPATLRSVSATALLEGTAPPDWAAGRAVLVGVSAAGAGDQFLLPVGTRDRPVPGVLMHAAVAASLLTGDLLRSPRPGVVIALIFLVALAVQWARTRAGRLTLTLPVSTAGALVAAAVLALWIGNVQLSLVALIVAAAASIMLREAAESRDAQRETGTILASLLSQQQNIGPGRLPHGVHGRLQLVKRLQDELARDRDLRRRLLEGLEEGVVLWDHDGRTLLGNAATTRLWGGDPTLAEVMAAAGAGAATSEQPAEVERGGRFLRLEVRAVKGGSLGLLRDVSVERELERRRRETQRLVSHELKTPLASIAGFGSMLQRYALSEEELRRVAGLIQGEADRLGAMVRTYLELERLGAGQLEAERSIVDLAELVRSRCAVLTPLAAERDQRIAIDATGPVHVHGAPPLLEQVVDNLIGNALKYSPEGGVVTVGVEGGAAVTLEVGDQGPGIPRDAVPHLFERFYRVPGATARGSGLGLAVVKEVVDWHGGAIEVQSEEGRGSTFVVRFPEAMKERQVHATADPGS